MYYPRNDFSSDFNSSPSNASKTTVVQIAAVLPQRKLVAIRSRLLRLTHPGRNKGEWTAKEIEQLLELHQQLGNAWTKIAKGLERLPESCRDKIRELTVVRDRETGTWSAAEEHLLGVACQKQWQLVRGFQAHLICVLHNTQLQLAVIWSTQQYVVHSMFWFGIQCRRTILLSSLYFQAHIVAQCNAPWRFFSTPLCGVVQAGKDDDENQTIVKGIYRVGNTRDGIDWGIVSKQVGTRSPIQCTQKWYKNLRPNMKSTGEWSDGQDTELLQALWKRQPSSVCILLSCTFDEENVFTRLLPQGRYDVNFNLLIF